MRLNLKSDVKNKLIKSFSNVKYTYVKGNPRYFRAYNNISRIFMFQNAYTFITNKRSGNVLPNLI